MKYLINTFVALVLVGIQAYAHAYTDLSFSHIGVEQGLSQVSVSSIYQDEIGAMWFATRQGLTRYNGTRADVYSTSSGGLLLDLIDIVDGDGQRVFALTSRGVNMIDLQTSRVSVLTRGDYTAMKQGASGLWLGRGNAVMRYAAGQDDSIRQVVSLPVDDAVIVRLCETTSGNLFVGTLQHGVFLMDSHGKVRQIVDIDSRVACIYEDSRQSVWIGTWHHGLICLQPDGTQVVYAAPQLSSDFVRAVVEDRKGSIWIGTKNGLDCLKRSGEISHYGAGKQQGKLSNESVWALMRDAQGTIWVGTYFGGVDYFNPETDTYRTYPVQTATQSMPVIDAIVEGKDGIWYLCTEGWGLYAYNPLTAACRVFDTSNAPQHGLRSDNIKRAWQDTLTGDIWLGTYLGGVSRFTPSSSSFRHYSIGTDWDQGNHVCGILPYGRGKMLIGTYRGIYELDAESGESHIFSPRLDNVINYCSDMCYDHDGNLWIGGRELVKYDMRSGRISRFCGPDSASQFSSSLVTRILVDRQGRVWISTDGGGLFRYDSDGGRLIPINTRNSGLQSNFVSNLGETPLGYVLATTNRGFSLINTDDNSVRNFTSEGGFPLHSLFNGGLCVLSTGDILLAGMDGLVSFREENLETPHRRCRLNLDRLTINSHVVMPGDSTRTLSQSVSYTSSIRLKANQNLLNIGVMTDNYIETDQPVVRYRLIGFSDEWINLQSGKADIQLMNLRRGRYELQVEAVSALDGSPLSERRSLDIRVMPPFYASWAAYAFYMAVVIFLIWLYIHFMRSRERLQARIRLEQQQAQQADAINQSKLRFFTNVSHEFRTPLTLIVGQMDMLLQQGSVPSAVYNRVLGMRRNAVNMQNLINELLEFRKVEQGYLTLRVGEHDVVRFARELFLSFSDYAKTREIVYRFSSSEEHLLLWFDEVQMQKVLYNLLSNAFKYSPRGASVTLSVEAADDKAVIRVADTGVGISAEDAQRIFDSFYQAENGAQLSHTSPGTGIGLALTKSIVELHHGTIDVESEPNAGSVFTVRLLRGNSHFEGNQQVELVDEQEIAYQPQPEDDEFIRELTEKRDVSRPMPKILIVEDNEELRQMLASLFSPLYDVTTAGDGQEGYETALELQPDIILSDLMMPRLNGSDMCARIKANFETCHIPVVLLTAWATTEYTIEGLRKGADDYISKPFNARVLISRCNNLINNRRMLQQSFGRQADMQPSMLADNPLDHDFMEKVNRSIEKNLDNADFSVPDLCTEVGIGRTTLFAKIKAITGQTPNDYIVTYRLKRAALLLRTNASLNVSEIAYATGFGTPKYFARCFGKQFGKSPSEFRKQATAAESGSSATAAR